MKMNVNKDGINNVKKDQVNKTNKESVINKTKNGQENYLDELRNLKKLLNQSFSDLKTYMISITESNDESSNIIEEIKDKAKNEISKTDQKLRLENKSVINDEKLEKYLVKLTNDELKYMNNLIGQMNQISNQMGVSTNNSNMIISNIENTALDTKNIILDSKIETRTFIEGISTDISVLIKLLILLFFLTIIFYYLYTQV